LNAASTTPVFFWGQFWGKTEMILVGVVLTACRRVAFPVEAAAS
jgi:hypothetical protein